MITQVDPGGFAPPVLINHVRTYTFNFTFISFIFFIFFSISKNLEAVRTSQKKLQSMLSTTLHWSRTRQYCVLTLYATTILFWIYFLFLYFTIYFYLFYLVFFSFYFFHFDSRFAPWVPSGFWKISNLLLEGNRVKKFWL